MNRVNVGIELASKAYYAGCPVMTDREFDQLSLDFGYPGKIEEMRVQGAVDVKHVVPMLSLHKVFSGREVKGWLKKVSRSDDELFMMMPKYDGASAVLYENGVMATRGDGFLGKDISSLKDRIDLTMIDCYPCRGEIVRLREKGMTCDDCRNDVFKLFSSSGCVSCRVDGKFTFIPHNTLKITFKRTGFHDAFLKMKEKVADWEYPTDGVVIAVEDTKHFENLGCTKHHPHGAAAIKWGWDMGF